MTNEAMVRLNRRGFLKMGAMSAAALALPRGWALGVATAFPEGEHLGRVTEPEVDVLSRPNPDGARVASLAFDDVVTVLRRVVGRGVYPHNHVWFETPDGFVWSPYLQPVRNQPSPLLESIPEEGVWTEIVVPFVDGRTAPDPAATVRYRLYYSMVLNVDGKVDGADGRKWYRVRDETNVVMYAPGESFRQILPDEVSPIHPEVEDKFITVDLTRQELSAWEAGVEVYFARVSSGYAIDEEGQRRWNTPIGQSWTWRKMISSHMAGGDRVSGYDLPGVGWTILFSGTGAAIHSTYWHNDFGTPRSRGCINVRPEDAQWLFRWSLPVVAYRPGDLTIQGLTGTRVIVSE
jgi:lipoprotein-anchoring transpeptidase ErfK/SrfK